MSRHKSNKKAKDPNQTPPRLLLKSTSSYNIEKNKFQSTPSSPLNDNIYKQLYKSFLHTSASYQRYHKIHLLLIFNIYALQISIEKHRQFYGNKVKVQLRGPHLYSIINPSKLIC